MSARACNAAAEHQDAGRVIEHGLTGGNHTKSFRFEPVVIPKHGHARETGGGSPQVGFLPVDSQADRLEENDVGTRTVGGASKKFLELAEARAGARALRM